MLTKLESQQPSGSSTLPLVQPRYLSIPPYEASYGPQVSAICELVGFKPDPEQQLLLNAAFAVDPKTNKSVAYEIAVIAPRQNLKTGFFKQVALGQLFVKGERLVVWSAHEFDTAQEALKDLEGLIEGSDSLRKRVKRVLHGAIPEIELMNGPRLKFKTRTAGGGRGLSGGKVILDEGYALQAGQTGALMPLMLAQPDPQVYYGSSACRPESRVLWEVVKRGREGGDPRLVYVEWCAPGPEDVCDKGKACDHHRSSVGCGCDKPEVIQLAHSAIARGRILTETLLDFRKSMPPGEYGREIMGWHDEPLDAGVPAIDPQEWAATSDQESEIETVCGFGVAVSLDRSWSCIGVAGLRADGTAHIEVVEHNRGTEWVLAKCLELDSKHGVSFVVDSAGPAARLIDPLLNSGVSVVSTTAREVSTACTWLVDAINERRVWHGPQPELDSAVNSAVRRNIGDGMFAFGRRVSTSDISPLEAVTLAGHLLQSSMGSDNVTVSFL